MPIALVNMPFGPAVRPSIQVGILRTLLDEGHLPAREFHASLEFFDLLVRQGFQSQHLAMSPSLLSEWYFSERPFDFDPAGADRVALDYFRQVAQASQFSLEGMRRLREELIPPFVARLADEIVDSGARVACFTLSFAQRNASFALAARLKERRPQLVTVFGGAASQVFEDSCRESMRLFPAVDVMLLGEAEGRFVQVVRALLEGRSPAGIPGIVHREAGEILCSGPEPPPVEPERMAIPSCGGWLHRARALPRATQAFLDVAIPMEIGRGCTWADHAACRFCAFTFHGRYRGKSSSRVLEEVASQHRTHRVRSFYVMDNVVPSATLRELMPAMARTVPGLVIPFLEVLSTLHREDLEVMAASGVVLVQPGTECFDDGLLRRIGKGTSTLHNVAFLKMARECGIAVSHNILLGVPQATPGEVESQRRTLEVLTHLDPPQILELQLVRFSEYHNHPERYGIRNVRAHPVYASTLPVGAVAERVAYEFVSDVDDAGMTALYTPTVAVLVQWHQRWKELPAPYLIHDADDGGVTVTDGRAPGRDPRVVRLEGLAGAVHEAVAEKPLRAEAIARAVGDGFPGVTASLVGEILDGLRQKSLVLEVRGRFLALALEGDRLRRWRRDLPGRSATPST